MPVVSTYSDRLKQIMSERNLRQVDILNMSLPYQKKLDISMTKSHLSQYVNGKSNPDQNRIYLLSKTLDINEAWLMGYDVPMKRIPDEERKNDEVSDLTETFDEILDVYQQLNKQGKNEVVDFAKFKLHEQNKEDEKNSKASNVKEFPSSTNSKDETIVDDDPFEVFAAHIDDDVTEEEMEEIIAYMKEIKKGKK